MSSERVYRGAVRAFSLVFVAIGLLVLVVTLANGGGPASLGFLMTGPGRKGPSRLAQSRSSPAGSASRRCSPPPIRRSASRFTSRSASSPTAASG